MPAVARLIGVVRTLFTVAMLHAFAVIAPGPDFAIVLRNSLRGLRTTAVATAIGIASGIGLHTTYTILGLSWMLERYPSTLRGIQLIGGAYLLVAGVRGLIRPITDPAVAEEQSAGHAATWLIGWRQGLLVNALNPGATLFVVSVFAGVVTPSAPLWLQVACAIEMVVATALWFGSLALMLTRMSARNRLSRFQSALTSVASIALVYFGARLLLMLKS